MYFVNFGGCKSDTSFYFYVSTFAKYMVITILYFILQQYIC